MRIDDGASAKQSTDCGLYTGNPNALSESVASLAGHGVKAARMAAVSPLAAYNGRWGDCWRDSEGADG